MSYRARTYQEIEAERRARILAGEKTNVSKGRCYFCDWEFHAKQREIFCSNDCRDSYHAEVAALTNGA